MKRWEKILGYTLTVILVISILISLIPQIFQKKLAGYVKNELEKSVDATVNFSKVGLSIFTQFPKISLGIKDLVVTGKGEFEGDTLLLCHKNIIAIDIKRYLKDKVIIIKKASFKSPAIYLVTDKNGKSNFDIFITDTLSVNTTDSTAINIKIENLSISDARLCYRNMADKTGLLSEGIYIDMHGDFTGTKADLFASAFVKSLNLTYDKVNLIKDVTISTEAEVYADFKLGLFKINDAEFKINELFLKTKGFVRKIDNGVFLNLTVGAPSTTFKDILSLIPGIYKKDFDKIRANGKVSLLMRIKGIAGKGMMPELNASLSIRDAWFKYSDLPKTVTNINIDMDYKSQGVNSHKINIDNFEFSVDKNFFRGNLDLALNKTAFVIDANVDSYFDLGEIRNFYHLKSIEMDGPVSVDLAIKGKGDYVKKDFSDLAVYGNISSDNLQYRQDYVLPIKVDTMNVSFTTDTIFINRFAGYYGNSHANVTGIMYNYLNYILYSDTLRARFDVKSDYVDLNQIIDYDYEANLVSKRCMSEAQSVTDKSYSDNYYEFLPANLDFTISLANKKTDWNFLPGKNIKTKVRLKNGHLLVDYLYADILEGKGFGQMDMYQLKDKNILLDGAIEFNNIDIQNIYKTLGIYKDLTPLLQSAQGLVSFSVFGSLKFSPQYDLDYTDINLSGTVVTDSIEFTSSNFFIRLGKILGYKELRTPKVEDVNMRFGIEKGNLRIPANYFTLAGKKASIEGYTNLNGFINYKMGLELPSGIIGKIKKRNKTNFLYVSIYGDVEMPQIKISTNLLKRADYDTTAKNMMARAIEDSLMALAHKEYAPEIHKAQKQADNIIVEANKQADEILQNAQKQVEDLINNANSTIEKRRIRRKIKKIVKKSRREANKVRHEGDKKAKHILKKSKKKATKEIQKARKEGKKAAKN